MNKDIQIRVESILQKNQKEVGTEKMFQARLHKGLIHIHFGMGVVEIFFQKVEGTVVCHRKIISRFIQLVDSDKSNSDEENKTIIVPNIYYDEKYQV